MSINNKNYDFTLIYCVLLYTAMKTILYSFFPSIYIHKSHHGAPKLSVELSVESYNTILVKINESCIEK